ncbi:hypothetical protein L596_007332 [Steinernema carpocapsae]|uniref:Uncharacterized protein n=1 Tax=Steinernema carpocapsae TaxID=34508 RepID=A0A4U5P8Y7_STECR|nr:hypothetical protein L596_007332 [Steinernema carpocapsae]
MSAARHIFLQRVYTTEPKTCEPITSRKGKFGVSAPRADGVNLVAQSSGMLSVTLARVQRHAREPATPPMLLVFQLGAQMSELAFYAFALSFGFFWRTRVLALALVPLCVELGSALCKDLRLLREPEKVNLEAEEDEESRTLLQE